VKVKRNFVITVFLLLCGFCFSEMNSIFQKSIRLLEEANYAFDLGEYGSAIKLAEEARITRESEAQNNLNILEDALKPNIVRKAGDSLIEVLSILKERQVYDAVSLIEYLINLKGEVFFNDSINTMKQYLEAKKKFPETYYLIAKVYEYEGEFDFAYSYFMQAWENRDVLDIPNQKFDILFDIATLSYNFSKYDDCEKALLLIIAEDPYYSDAAFKTALLGAVTRGYSADKIFDLYRTNCYRSISALFKLAELYEGQGRVEEAYSTSFFGVLTSFTRMYEVLMNRTTDFEYNSLTNFFEIAMSYDDIASWSIEKGFWQCLYRLATTSRILYPDNNFGINFLNIIANYAPENYWRQLAINKIYEKN